MSTFRSSVFVAGSCFILGTRLLSGCGSDAAKGPGEVGVADGGGGETSATASVKITAFTSAQPLVEFGATTMLSWQIAGPADDVTLDGVSVAGKLTLPVSPVRRQTFTLRALRGGAVVDTAVVSVAAHGIDLLAGDLRGSSNFDGAGNVAGFNRPAGVALDAAGNAYVADTSNREIRKVAPDGTVTTLAGDPHAPGGSVDGVGKSAHFSYPSAIAVHPSGFLYVADMASHVVRKVLANGTVTTIAGLAETSGMINGSGSAARFNSPVSLLLLPSGDLLVAEQGNCAIRRIAPDFTVTTAYGTLGTCGGTNVPPAQFDDFQAMALDGLGNIYVTEECHVRQITPGGVVSTYAGSKTCGSVDGDRTTTALFQYIVGIAVDASNNVYVADSSRVIRKITGNTVAKFTGSRTAIGASDGAATLSGFDGLAGIAIRPSGELVVLDTNSVRTVSPTGTVSTLAGTRQNTDIADGPLGTSRLGSPSDLTAGVDGSVVLVDMAQYYVGAVRHISRDGTTSTLAGGGGSTGSIDGFGGNARFDQPFGITSDTKSTFWIAEYGSATVRQIDPTGLVTTLAGIPGVIGALDGAKGVGTLAAPFGVARDSKGNLIVLEYTNIVRRISPDGTLSTLTGTAGTGYVDGDVSVAKFAFPRAIAIDAADNLYLADFGNSVVRKITAGGVVSTFAGTPMIPGNADGPKAQATLGLITGLVVDGNGNVFACDLQADAVRKISPDGSVSTVAGTRGLRGNRPGPLPGSLSSPGSIAVTSDGDLVVTTNAAVLQITAP